jgi:hypothetical protein
VAGGDEESKADREITELRAEIKAAREAAAPLWPDTAARLGRLEAALEARQDGEGE